MLYKNTIKAFTLIEILVGISIISIILLWVTSIDYNALNNKQKLEIFTNDVKAHFENIRNNALAGKWIGVNLDVPKVRKIEYSLAGSGSIQSYTSIDGSTWTPFNSLRFISDMSITQIRCWWINDSHELAYSDPSSYDILDANATGSILIEGSILKLETWISNCEELTDKYLELTLSNRIHEKVLEFNMMNGLTEIR